MSVPLGVSPNGRIFLPSGSVASVTTKVHVPTSCCLIVWARATFDPAPSSRVAKITAASFEIDFIRPPIIGKNAITNLAREIPARESLATSVYGRSGNRWRGAAAGYQRAPHFDQRLFGQARLALRAIRTRAT